MGGCFVLISPIPSQKKRIFPSHLSPFTSGTKKVAKIQHGIPNDNIQIAAELGIQHLDSYTHSLLNGGTSLLSDGTHLTAAGHRLMADALKPYFTTGTPLPVHLKHFSAENSQGSNKLIWEVTNPTAFQTYEVERSHNGTNFTSIGTVASNGILTYSFTDPHPGTQSFYRLKMMNPNALPTYSQVVMVQAAAAANFSIYPNPAKDQLTIHAGGLAPRQIKILDLSGRIIKAMYWPAQATTSSINISHLTPGYYILQAGSETRKFIKH